MLRRLMLVLAAAVGVLTLGCASPPPEGEHPFRAHPWAMCIRHHESDRGPAPHTNGYGEKNPSSSASGAYQFLDRTWQTLSVKAGYGGTSSARDASPWVQDAVASYAYHEGFKGHWTARACRNL